MKDWIETVREPSEEDLIVKRKVYVEVRGLPITSWSEDNLKKVCKNLGTWDWWINRPDMVHRLENPKNLHLYR